VFEEGFALGKGEIINNINEEQGNGSSIGDIAM
jgi:hypothetical protein